MFTVGVIIPTGDDAVRLTATLRGYQRQTYKKFEVHVVNDGAHDCVREAVERCAGPIPIYCHDLAGSGYRPASARNLGLDVCHAQRVILSDCDAVPSPTAVERHAARGTARTYVLGIRRLVSRTVAENLVLTRELAGLPVRYGSIPSTGDHRLHAGSLSYAFGRMIDGSEPDVAKMTEYYNHFGIDGQMPGNSWKGLLCWTFNVSLPSPKIRFDQRFDNAYGTEDLEFAVRLIADQGHVVEVDKSIVCYHLNHAKRAAERAGQSDLLHQTIERIRARPRR